MRKPAQWIQDLKAKAKVLREDEDLIHNRVLHQQILETWKRGSPKMYLRLKLAGVLDDQAFVAQEQMWREMDQLLAAGMPYPDAKEQAEKEHLMLEPESEQADEEPPHRHQWIVDQTEQETRNP